MQAIFFTSTGCCLLLSLLYMKLKYGNTRPSDVYREKALARRRLRQAKEQASKFPSSPPPNGYCIAAYHGQPQGAAIDQAYNEKLKLPKIFEDLGNFRIRSRISTLSDSCTVMCLGDFHQHMKTEKETHKNNLKVGRLNSLGFNFLNRSSQQIPGIRKLIKTYSENDLTCARHPERRSGFQTSEAQNREMIRSSLSPKIKRNRSFRIFSSPRTSQDRKLDRCSNTSQPKYICTCKNNYQAGHVFKYGDSLNDKSYSYLNYLSNNQTMDLFATQNIKNGKSQIRKISETEETERIFYPTMDQSEQQAINKRPRPPRSSFAREFVVTTDSSVHGSLTPRKLSSGKSPLVRELAITLPVAERTRMPSYLGACETKCRSCHSLSDSLE